MIGPKDNIKEPFTPILEEEGDGYYGVLMHDDEQDLIQCHQCGRWFREIMPAHLQTHKCSDSVSDPVFDVPVYKERYGFPPSYALCTDSLRDGMRDHAINQMENGKIRALTHGQYGKKAGSKKAKLAKHGNRYRGSHWDNKYDMCKAQLKKWLGQIIDQLGHIPGQDEIPVSTKQSIKRRYGTWNKFLKAMDIADRPKHCQYSDDELLGFLRDFHKKHNRLPRCSDFQKEDLPASRGIYHGRFGGLRPARIKAGIE